MSKKYQYGIIIGRFQGFHNNHKAIIDNLLNVADKVIVLFGSANRPLSSKNPFDINYREAMISKTYNSDRIMFGSLIDIKENARWVMNTQSIVDSMIQQDGNDPDDVSICITGNKNDKTSFYIDFFKDWDYIEPVGFDETINHIHSTDIREILFDSHDRLFELYGVVPINVLETMGRFRMLDSNWLILKEEHDYIKKYKKAWESAPYPCNFITTDAIVTQNDHILLIQRKNVPGKGLWAMPGGFLDTDEQLEDGMLRELNEETKIKIPVSILRKYITKKGVYDDPYRSTRGRILTHAFLIELPPSNIKARIKGSDDAAKAVWLPISELTAENMFEDHYFIIKDMLGI
jgi:bifunctional NMN adenylyltransferase/nudix hydrolase